MAGTLFTNYRPVFVDPTTGEPLALGSIAFYENETSTPKAVYSDPDLAVSLGTTVELDAEGRTATPIYLSGAYSYELLDASDVQIDQTDGLNNVTASGFLALDPADATEDQVASSDGVNALWRTIREVPDPTGHSGKVLKTADGETWAWLAEQTLPTYDADNLPAGITESSSRIVIGNTAIVIGSDTASSTGTLKTTKAVTFGTAFSGTPTHISCTPTTASSTGEGAGVSTQCTGYATTGFTANFFAGAEDNGGVAEINSAVTFTYMAIGPA